MEEPAAKKTRGERATQEQLQCYVQFCREHPEFQTGKNNPNNPQLVSNLWSQVAEKLNAQRGPSRTAGKWKESLGLWKYQLRTRARKLKMEQRLTGGGPCGKSLSEFEELALATFGAPAVDGVAEISDLGVVHAHSRALSLPPSPGAISLPPSPAAVSLPPNSQSTSMPPSPGASSLPPSPAAAPIPNKDNLIREILESMRRRDERDRTRDERDAQILEVLKSISNSLNNK